MSSYEFRSSDIDFALFLVDVDPNTVRREWWVRPVAVSETEFKRALVAIEAMVSPDVLAEVALLPRAQLRERRRAA